jgi:NitT/TauT family transport system ATP-binding protein
LTRLSSKEKSFLEIKELTIEYEVNKKIVTALDNINFEAKQFERLVLLGPSGCGKSSILKAVGGFIKPANGQIIFDGIPITKPAIDRAFVFQEFDQLLPWKTAIENIIFALTSTKKIKKDEALNIAKESLKKVNLANFENNYPHQLSGGMKMRVAIARCLALDSKVILMDEPFASLDAITRRKMQDDLLNLWKDTNFTMIFVTHSIEEAIKLGSKIIILSSNPGMIIKEIEVNSFTSKEEISSIMFKNSSEYFI